MSEEESQKEYDFEATLVFIISGRKVLLAPKIKKIGKGRYNGYGGEIEHKDPSIESRAIEELWQEAGVVAQEKDLQKVAIGYFINIKDDGDQYVCKVHIFLVESKKCTGTPRPTNEMGVPQWFDMDKMPYDDMMASDRYWLPEIFKGRKIVFRVKMKNNQREVINHFEFVEVQFL